MQALNSCSINIKAMELTTIKVKKTDPRGYSDMPEHVHFCWNSLTFVLVQKPLPYKSYKLNVILSEHVKDAYEENQSF